MKKKIVTILISIMIISTIFMEVSAVVVNQQVQGTNKAENTNTAKNEVNKVVEHAQNSQKSEESETKKAEEKKTNSQAEENKESTEKTEQSKEAKEEENKTNTEKDEVKEEANKEKTEKEDAEKEEESKESTEKTEENKEKEEGEEKANTEEKEEYISEDDLIYSNKYLVKEKVISRIEPKTSIKEFKKNIEIAKGQEIKIYKGKEEITSGNIGTGMTIKGTNGEEYTTSVIGDITGDGIANQIELTMIIRHIIKLKGWELEGIKKASADITGDGKINLVDITKLINYIVYGTWEKEEIKTPKEPEIKVISKKEEGQDYYISEVKIKIEGAKEQKTTYKITGNKEQEEKEIKEDKTVTITGAGKYIITAYSYGKEGNRSKGVNKVITIKEVVPNLTKENTKISYTPTEWTKGPVEVKIETEVETEKEGCTLQYSKDGEKWEDYSKEIKVEGNGEIYARLRDKEGRAGGTIKETIENIDRQEPEEVTIERVTQNTNSIEIEADAKDQEATEKDGKSEIAKYYYSIDGGKTWEPEEGQRENIYKFENLTQNKEYKVVVKAEDKAGNSKETEIKEVTTGEVPEGTGNIEIKKSEENWTNKKIKITIENKAGEEYEIEYSKDGENWENYSKEIEIEENGKIYARLKDSIGNVGKEVEETIENIDKLVPTVKLEPNGGENYTIPSEGEAKISTTISAEDPEKTETNGQSGLNTLEYAWSQSKEEEPEEWTTFENGSKVEKADIAEAGTWYLWTKVEDEAGNRAEEIKVSEAFTISANTTEANKITLEPNIEAEEWTNGDVTVQVDYGENLSGETKITVTGEEGKDYEIDNKGNIIVKTNGTTVTVEAKDAAGNVISKTIKVENIDKVAPTVNAEVPTNWTTGNKTITVSGSDGESQVAGYYVGTESTAPEANAAGWSMNTTYSKGVGTYYVWSKDNAGNISEVKEVEVINISTIKPIIELSANSNEEWAKSRNVTVTLRDNKSGLAEGAVVKYGWSTSNTTAPTSYTTATLNYTAGAETVTFTASISEETGKYYLWVEPRALTNIAGESQTEITKSTGTFYIDNTVPTVEATAPTNWTTGNKTITVSGSDADSGVAGYYVGTENTAPEAIAAGWSMNTTYSKGVGTYYVWSKDNVGNISEVKEVEVTNIDIVKPTITVSETSGDYVTSRNMTITVADNEGGSGLNSSNSYQYYLSTSDTSLSGGEWLDYTSEVEFTIGTGKTGTYYLFIKRISDEAGNISTENGTAVAINGTTYQKFGAYKFDNEAPTAGTLTMKLDSSASSNYTNNTWTNQSVYIEKEDGSDAHSGHSITTYSVSLEGETKLEHQTAVATLTEEGTYIVTVTTTDNVGKTASNTYTIKIDKTEPTIESLTATTTNWTNNDVTLSGKGADTQSGIVAYQFSQDSNLSTESSGWTDITVTTEQISKNYTAENTGTWYFYVKDAAGNINKKEIEIKIDKTEPTITIPLNSPEQTGKTISLSIKVKDSISGISEIRWYYKKSTEGTYNEALPRTSDTTMNGSTKGTTTEMEATKTLEGLEVGTTYDIYVEVFDVAGNSKREPEGISKISVQTKEINPQVGDYVNYEPDTVTNSYTLYGKHSGYTSQENYLDGDWVDETMTEENTIDQEIQQEQLTWQVLKIHNDGRIDLIGSPSSEGVTFQGSQGYNNGVLLLNDMCKTLYSKEDEGIYARSVSLENFEDDSNGGNWKNTREGYALGDFPWQSTFGRDDYGYYYPDIFWREIGAFTYPNQYEGDRIGQSDNGYSSPTDAGRRAGEAPISGKMNLWNAAITEAEFRGFGKSPCCRTRFYLLASYSLDWP